MRFNKLFLGSVLALGLWSCAGDEDLNEGRGAGDDTGGSANYDVSVDDTNPPPDTSVDSGVDTSVDTFVPDTFVPDTSMPDLGKCTSASECPGTDTECNKRACASGVCRMDPVAPDTPVTEIKGDCKKQQCDGAGGIKDIDDFTDTPANMGECNTGTCDTTGAKQTPKPSGTACTTGGSVCDGKGNCVECVSATTCPGTDTECTKRACVANKCTMMNLADGTATDIQTANDCKLRVCDGAGNVKTIAADTDLPLPDSNVCTKECCKSGVASTCAPDPGTKCNSTTCDVSRPGICGECNVLADCPTVPCKTKTSCTSNRCVYTNQTGTTCKAPDGVTDWWCNVGVCTAPIG